MKTFRDNEGREWRIALDLYAIQRIYNETQIDLLMPEAYLAQVTIHPLLFAEILPVLLEEQLEPDTTKEQILKRFSGKPYFDAEAAFLKELVDFFHRAGRSGNAKRISEYLKKLGKLLGNAGINGMMDGETVN